MEYQTTPKKRNGISTLYLPLKRDPFWIREWVCLITLYFFEKSENQKNFNLARKSKSFYRKRTNDFLMIERFLK